MHRRDSELRLALPVSGGASGTDKHGVVDAAGVAEREPVFLLGERRNQWTGENRKEQHHHQPAFRRELQASGRTESDSHEGKCQREHHRFGPVLSTENCPQGKSMFPTGIIAEPQ